MKAIVVEKYGKPIEVLKLKNVDKPIPKADEVLIKIKCTAINDYDWVMSKGKPYALRLMFGFKKPKNPILGMEYSGVVEEIGDNITGFNIGDEVFGDCSESNFGTFSEYICLHKEAIIKKPKGISFEHACALPHASLLAYQGLFEKAKLNKRDKVLINGAGGGVGAIALNLAKTLDCHVTGVDTGDKLATLIQNGYDEVIDYKKVNFTENNIKYDIIFDCKTSFSPFSYPKVLNKNGRYVSVGGNYFKLIRLLLSSNFIKLLTDKQLLILGLKANQGISEIIKLYNNGEIKPIIDGPHQLEKTPELVQYFGDGLHTGKIIISIKQNLTPSIFSILHKEPVS